MNLRICLNFVLLLKESLIPENWENDKKCNIVKISEDSEEFIRIRDKFHNSGLNDKIVVSIERIQNEKLYFQYQMKKKIF